MTGGNFICRALAAGLAGLALPALAAQPAPND
jgi:hypothetical protein